MARSRLIHFFTPPLLKVLEIIEIVTTAQLGRITPPLTADDALHQVKRLLDDATAQAQRHGSRGPEADRFRHEEVSAARYAVVAFLDDRFPKLAPWWGRERKPLAYELYGDYGSGDRVFQEQVNKFGAQQDELKEIYAVVLGLGFRGRADRADDFARQMLQDTLGRLTSRLRPEPVAPDEGDARWRLLPQPYGVSPPPPPAMPRTRPWWLYSLAAAVLLILASGLIWQFMDVDPQKIARERFAGLDCAALQVHPGTGRTVRVTGRVADGLDFRGRVEALKASGITVEGAEGVAVRPRPFCEVLEVLEAHSATGPEAAPEIMVNRPDGHYQISEYFHASVTPRQPSARNLLFLFVSRDDDGQFRAVSMVPSPVQDDDAIRAGQPLRVGRPYEEVTRIEPGWQLDGPVGSAMAVAIAAPSRLIDPARLQDPIAIPDLVALLRQALPSPGTTPSPSVASAHAMIEIGPAVERVLQARLRLRNLPCSLVEPSDAGGGRLRLSGRASDRRLVESQLGELASVTDFSALRLVPSPLCSVLDGLESYAVFDRLGAPLPRIALPRLPPQFRIGEPFWLDATASEAYSGYLTVLYIAPSQPITQLLPRTGQQQAPVAAGALVQIGHQGGGRGAIWETTGPPAPNMLIAISSPQPLLMPGEQLSQHTPDALEQLRQAMRRQPGGRNQIFASHVILEVLPNAAPPGSAPRGPLPFR